MGSDIWNAKITGTKISMSDHGCLTFWVYLEGAGCGCGFGGYAIGHGCLGAKEFEGSGIGLEAMMRIMNVVGVENWEDLKGHFVRALEKEGSVVAIGNLLEEKWFNIKEFFAEKQKESPKKPLPKNVEELREFVVKALKEKYYRVDPLYGEAGDIIVDVEEYHNGRNDVWIQFPYFHSRG